MNVIHSLGLQVSRPNTVTVACIGACARATIVLIDNTILISNTFFILMINI